ncbi:MAG: hypothetical protein ACPKOI_08195 [Pleomorphochaeta sp.]
MEYKKLINIIINYINNNEKKETAEKFCNEFMDTFYAIQNNLEKEISQNIFEMLDDINLICDSYEANIDIRKADKYCIGEIELKNKVIKYFKKIQDSVIL